MNIFSNVDQLGKATAASWLRADTINNNIANVETPNFKRSSVAFEQYYKSALDGSRFQQKQTRQKHRTFGEDGGGTARVVRENTTTMRMDGNNVDIDREMTDMARNVIYYNTLTTQTSKQFEALRIAITGR